MLLVQCAEIGFLNTSTEKRCKNKHLKINKIKTGIHFAFLVLLQDYGNDAHDYSGSRGLFFCM
jgi:hypothetical protein